jgi:hypothetical protein
MTARSDDNSMGSEPSQQAVEAPTGTGTPPGSGRVRTIEEHAQFLAHVLDDAITVRGTGIRLGLDPIVGVLPLIGDALATTAGFAILMIGRQLRVPLRVLARMVYNIFINGMVGSLPILGDLFSLWFRSNAKNAALLLRAVSKGDGTACEIVAPPLRVIDVAFVLGISVPVLLMVASLSLFFWERGMTLISPFGR